MNLGDLINAWRTVEGVSLRKMAVLIGVSAATLSRFERNQNPNAQVLAKVLKWCLENDLIPQKGTMRNGAVIHWYPTKAKKRTGAGQ